MADKKNSEEKFQSELAKINKQLGNHGGDKNMINMEALSAGEAQFVRELVNHHLADYIKTAKERLADYFYAEIESGKMKTIPVHCKEINIPKDFDNGTEWEMTLGDKTFFGPVIVFNLKGWEEADVTLVG